MVNYAQKLSTKNIPKISNNVSRETSKNKLNLKNKPFLKNSLSQLNKAYEICQKETTKNRAKNFLFKEHF